MWVEKPRKSGNQWWLQGATGSECVGMQPVTDKVERGRTNEMAMCYRNFVPCHACLAYCLQTIKRHGYHKPSVSKYLTLSSLYFVHSTFVTHRKSSSNCVSSEVQWYDGQGLDGQGLDGQV